MLERNVTVTLEKAKEWYNSDNATLKEVALQAFSERELNVFDFTKIKTFKDALRCIYKPGSCEYNFVIGIVDGLRCCSKASAAMFMLNIVRKVLNTGYDLHLTKNAEGQVNIWYPCLKFVTKSSTYYDNELRRDKYKKLGEITSEDVIYDVVCGRAYASGYTGLGGFNFEYGIGFSFAHLGFFGCATEDIANHFGRYFGMLIMEAMYGDMVDFKKTKA